MATGRSDDELIQLDNKMRIWTRSGKFRKVENPEFVYGLVTKHDANANDNIYGLVTKHDADGNDNIYDCVVMHDADTNDNIHDCVALHDAYTTDHFLLTSTRV